MTWTAPDANGTTITGYQVQYRKQGDTAWTLYSYTDGDGDITSALPATPTGMTLPDLAAGATYEFQVRALTSLEGPGPWSDTGSARANRPPGLTTTFLIDVERNRGGTLGTTVSEFNTLFNDADGDTLTPSVQAQYPGILSVWVIDNGVHAFASQGINPGQSKMTYGAHDEYGGYASREVTLSFVDNQTRQIAENSAADTAVGAPVTGTPYQPETLSYTLTGDAADAFVINATTGQISVAEGAALDYETKSSYIGKVHWTVQGQAAVANVTIEVTDAEAGQPDAPTMTRTRFDEPTNPALDVTWTAPDANGTTITGYQVQYRKQGDTAWTLYSYTDAEGNVMSTLPATPTGVTLPDLAAGATYEIQVRALTSLEGPGPWSDSGSARANRPPISPNTSTGTSAIRGGLASLIRSKLLLVTPTATNSPTRARRSIPAR